MGKVKEGFAGRPWHYTSLLVVIALGVALRSYYLFNATARNDEICSFTRFAARSPGYGLPCSTAINRPPGA